MTVMQIENNIKKLTEDIEKMKRNLFVFMIAKCHLVEEIEFIYSKVRV